MATALRINASSETRSSPHERKRKSTDSHDGNNDKRNPSVMSDKYIHVHHYLDTGRWGTWFNDPTLKRGSGKRRLYFGTYETEYLAARAQDRAALKFKPYAVRPITRLNFAESDYELDKDLRDNLTHEQFRRLLMAESRKCYRRAEPSPCWKIFLEEEVAAGNILIDCGNRSNRFHREPRTFAEVLQEIVNKNEVVNIEETTEPIDEPVTTGKEEGKVYTAKRSKRPSPSAPNLQQAPGEEVTKELVAEDSAALPTRSLSARKARHSTSVAAERIRHDTRSVQVRKLVGKAILVSAPRIRHDTRSASLSSRQVRTANPTAVSPVHCDTKSSGLIDPQVRKTTQAPRIVLRRDTRNPGQSVRLLPTEAPQASPPVRRESSIIKRGVRHAEGEGRSSADSLRIAVYLDHLEWGRTRGRSRRDFNKLSLPNAASTDEATTDEATVATVAADSLNLIMMAANILSVVPNGTSGTSDGKVALGSDHTTVENPSKRKRLNIDLNHEPEPSSTANTVASPLDSDATGGNDDPEVTSVETLLLLKSGWLHEVIV